MPKKNSKTELDQRNEIISLDAKQKFEYEFSFVVH
jgi:hypothetical protein